MASSCGSGGGVAAGGSRSGAAFALGLAACDCAGSSVAVGADATEIDGCTGCDASRRVSWNAGGIGDSGVRGRFDGAFDLCNGLRRATSGSTGLVGSVSIVLSFSRKRRTTDGSVTPMRRIAVVGRSAVSDDSRVLTARNSSRSSIPVPFGRPRGLGGMLIGCAHGSIASPARGGVTTKPGRPGHYPGRG